MGYVLLVTSKRTKSKAPALITGVASGSLGTAANLDETQVLRTADLEAAALPWLDEHVPGPDAEPEVGPRPAAAPIGPTAPVVATTPQARPRIQPQSPQPGRRSANRRVPALAGAAVVLALLVVAGAGFFSRLDLGSAGGTGADQSGGPSFEAFVEPSRAATPEPQAAGKDHKCKGKGHGNNCND
jgi:hypothetical protein